LKNKKSKQLEKKAKVDAMSAQPKMLNKKVSSKFTPMAEKNIKVTPKNPMKKYVTSSGEFEKPAMLSYPQSVPKMKLAIDRSQNAPAKYRVVQSEKKSHTQVYNQPIFETPKNREKSLSKSQGKQSTAQSAISKVQNWLPMAEPYNSQSMQSNQMGFSGRRIMPMADSKNKMIKKVSYLMFL